MADGSRSRLQSILVTITAICAVIGVAYTIWTSYWRPTTELQATVEYGTYLIDPWTAASMSADSKKLGAIVRELSDYRYAGGRLSAPLEAYADDAFKARKYDSITFNSSQTYGYMRTAISDEGALGAKDVALRVPNAVGSLVTFDDGAKKVFGRSPTIDLGDLKPEQKVTVYSWFLSPPTFFLSTNNGISLTYAGGKGSVEIPDKHNLTYQVLTSPVFIVYYAMGGLGALLWVWQLGFKRGRNQSKFEPDSAHPNRDAGDSD